MSESMSRGQGVALWRQIAETLGAEVQAGRLKPGERLATELELAERFAVNRHTVRRAMATLVEQGLLRVEQGRGTFVNGATVDYVLGRRTRFSANLAAQGREPGHRLLAATSVTVSGSIAADLELPDGAPVLRVETLGIAEKPGIFHAEILGEIVRFLPEELRRTLQQTLRQAERRSLDVLKNCFQAPGRAFPWSQRLI